MPRGDAVITHPDSEEITHRLLNGESVKAVEGWLKQKHPRNKKEQLSWMTLQSYRSNRLNLEGEVLSEIKEERKEVLKEEKEKRRQDLVKQSSSYVAAKRKIAENILNVEQEIVDIHDKVWARIRVLENEETKHLNDRVICDYLGQARTLLMDYMKLVENQDKKTGDTTINVNMLQVTQQMNALKQCIIDSLRESGVEHVIPVFLEKLEHKLEVADFEQPAFQNQVNIQVNN